MSRGPRSPTADAQPGIAQVERADRREKRERRPRRAHHCRGSWIIPSPQKRPDTWTLYSGHRARFTAALSAAADEKPSGRLCLLGAGACDDVALDELAGSFAEIHLVDIDAAAVAEAPARLPAADRPRVHRHAPVDLSGLRTRLPAWKKAPPTFAEIESAANDAVKGIVTVLPGPFDVVASACVITQMSFHMTDVLGDRQLMLGPIRQALLTTHLRTMLELTVSGGRSLLVTDLTSSNAYPLDHLAPGCALGPVMDDVVARAAFYVTADPNLIKRLLRREPALRGRAGEPELIEPWLWSGAFNRTYLVYGLRLQRA